MAKKQDVAAPVDYTGVGVIDAKAMFGGAMQSDKLKRERVMELAPKLNGDQQTAWLDGLKKGCKEMGFTDGSARNARTEFSAILKAYALTVVMLETVKAEDGTETTKETKIVASEVLPKATGWNAMRDLARGINKAAAEQGVTTDAKKGSGTKGTKAMQDSTFDRVYEDVAKRATGGQCVQVLDLAITGISKHYSGVVGTEIVALREIEAKIIEKVTAFHKSQKAQGNVIALVGKVATATEQKQPEPQATTETNPEKALAIG